MTLFVLRGWLRSFHDNYSISTLLAGNFSDGFIPVSAEHGRQAVAALVIFIDGAEDFIFPIWCSHLPEVNAVNGSVSPAFALENLRTLMRGEFWTRTATERECEDEQDEKMKFHIR